MINKNIIRVSIIIFLFSFFGYGIISASINDIKPVVCNSINLTEPNCTTWWNTLNLTDANLTKIDINYIIENNNYTTVNQTVINNTYINITYQNITNQNITYEGNYTIYNVTNNITNPVYQPCSNGTNCSYEILNDSISNSFYNKTEVDKNLSEYTKQTDLKDYVPYSEISNEVNKVVTSLPATTVQEGNEFGFWWKFMIWLIGILVLLLVSLLIYYYFYSIE